MPATAARAAFVQQDFRSLIWEDDGVKALYGNAARDTGDSPIDTYFDDMSSVQAMLDERSALLGSHAWAYRARLAGLADVDGTLSFGASMPGAHVSDTELLADIDCAVVSIEAYDMSSDTTTVTLWGTM